MAVNYRTEFFEHVDLTPIAGEPDFESLNRLKNELKRNAQNVPCPLGGGNHGFLGMVLTAAEYAVVVPAHQFVAQAHPGNLTIPAGTTAIQARVQESNYNNRMKLYEQCVAMEKALKQQIVKAIHEDWLEPLRNPITNSIDHTILNILAYLFTQHGDVSADALVRRETEVKNINYDPSSDPIDTIFTAVQTLAEFAAAANAAYTEQQIINLAYVIIKKQRVFNQASTEFNREIRATPSNNTWQFFKTFFRQAYRELKEVGELTIADTPFNEANIITGIVEALQQTRLNAPAPPAPAVSPPVNETRVLTEAANSVHQPVLQSPDLVTSLLTQMISVQDRLNHLNDRLQYQYPSTPVSNPSRGRGNRSGGRGRGRTNTNMTGRGGPRRMYYCWSHGWCYHPGVYCRDRREGHVPSATADNRMGGSDEGLPPGYT